MNMPSIPRQVVLAIKANRRTGNTAALIDAVKRSGGYAKEVIRLLQGRATVLLHHVAEDVTGRIDNHDVVIIGNIHEEEK